MTEPKKPPITKSFGYAFEGIFTCIRRERNMKIHCVMAVLVVIAGLILGLSPIEVYLSGSFRAGDGAGTGEYSGRISGGSCDQ